MVQDAYLRWAKSDASATAHTRAYLARVVTIVPAPEAGWGFVAVFQDPDGNRLQLRQGHR